MVTKNSLLVVLLYNFVFMVRQNEGPTNQLRPRPKAVICNIRLHVHLHAINYVIFSRAIFVFAKEIVRAQILNIDF